MTNMRSCFAALVLSIVLLASGTSSYGSGIPTFDGAVLAPSVTGAISNMAQQLKQIEQYRLQLQQYVNMLQNTMNLGLFICDNAQETMNYLRYIIETVSL